VSAEYKYSAFISYSHKDEKWASWLHKALETFKVPKYLVGETTGMGTIPERMGKVFRDREELSSSHSLGTELTQALEDSACQIVICSPNSANSHWTNEEILTYKRLGRENRIFCLIVDGEPGTDHAECFPPALRFKMGTDGLLSDEPAEPIAADARPQGDGKLNAKIKLIAGMLGVGFDALKQRELVRRKKRKAIMTTASVAAIAVISGLAYSVYLNVTAVPPVELEPISVLIADFDNRTGNPVFNGLLEQALTVGIEGAPHVTSYQRNDALSLASRLQPGIEVLDAAAARLVAVREGINLVLAGLVTPDGSGYDLALEAVDPATGEVVFDVSSDARSQDAVLTAIGELSEEIREELGDTTVDEDVDATAETFTAASLEAAQAYTTAIQLAYEGKHDEAVALYSQATEMDPNFGRAFSGWALSEFKLGRTEKAAELWQKALSLMETMTERERLRTLGLYYARVTRNYENAVESFSELVSKYPADAAGHNNLAVTAFLSLDFQTASIEGRRIMEIYPNSQLYRSNYALYSMYSGDFESAEAEAQALIDDQPEYGTSYLPLAIARIASNDLDGAREAYRGMAAAETSEHRESLANLGLADISSYAGEFDDARRILKDGIDKDIAAENSSAAAVKYIALAETYTADGDYSSAIAAAKQALGLSAQDSIAVPAARVFLDAGDIDAAAQIASELTKKLQSQSRAYGLMLQASIARIDGNYVEAIDLLRSAIELADLWLVRFELGRSYLDAGYSAEALDQFLACEERRGEATAIFLDDTPTYRFLATLPYWTGRAQQGLGMRTAANQGYEKFLALRPGGGPLADDARQRLP
jgi:tetratricopeptide (TPR) repeat protein